MMRAFARRRRLEVGGRAKPDSSANYGTTERPKSFPGMTISLSQLLEESLQIAWEYLERTGELGDGAEASRFLSEKIEAMIRRGERSRLAVQSSHQRLSAL
jgi:hypothetical protein